MNLLTWKCMVCGAERLDAYISVLHVPMPGWEDHFPGTRVNVRYCNDNPNCVAAAPTYRLGSSGQ